MLFEERTGPRGTGIVGREIAYGAVVTEDDELRGVAADLNDAPGPWMEFSNALGDRNDGIHRKKAAAPARIDSCRAGVKAGTGESKANLLEEIVDRLPIVNPLFGIAYKVDIPTGVEEYCLGIDGSEVKPNGMHVGLLDGQGFT